VAEKFNGFDLSENALTSIPADFFRLVMPAIQDANLLKLCLYVLWKADTVGDYQISFTADGLVLDKIFSDGLTNDTNNLPALIDALLHKAVESNILLGWQSNQHDQSRYFINCDAGAAAHKQASLGARSSHITLDQIKPNIYKVYEENIGPLTPLIADTLRDAEETYPADWIKEAMEIAIENNVRRWRYVESILDRWKKEGRNGTDRRRDKTDYRSYLDD
jgi:DNA replication protein